MEKQLGLIPVEVYSGNKVKFKFGALQKQ